MTRQKMHNGHLLIANIILQKIGNQKPYFSVTGEEWEVDARGQKKGRECVACGCLHEDILAAWPDLAPVVALHLSDQDGIPVHAIENGWYWNGGTDWTPYKRETLASHLRITPEQADILHNNCKNKEEFKLAVEQEFPRWKEEAEKAIREFIA